MRIISIFLCLTTALLILATPPSTAHSTTRQVNDGKHHWFMPNHPRLRRITKAVGLGVATGGIIGPILGTSVAAGAVAGGAEHGAIRGGKDHHDVKHKGKLDHHIW